MRSKQGGKWLGEGRLDLEERRHYDHIQTLPGGGEQGVLKALSFQCGFQGWPAGKPFPARLGPILFPDAGASRGRLFRRARQEQNLFLKHHPQGSVRGVPCGKGARCKNVSLAEELNQGCDSMAWGNECTPKKI